MRNGGSRRVSSFITQGYRTRRMAVDYAIPLVTDVKCAKLLIEALQFVGGEPKLQTSVDCISAGRVARLPGLVDIHVHMRDPGQTHKEDWSSGTSAALAGGFTVVCAMPNTEPPVVDRASLVGALEVAKAGARCDYALYCGATGTNFERVAELAPLVMGMKMYLNDTFSTLQMDDMSVWLEHMRNWPTDSPIVVHAEDKTMSAAIFAASLIPRSLHVTHVSKKSEILTIKAAKAKGIAVTCDVCPHHLFLSTEDVLKLGSKKSQVRPVLGSMDDQNALWDNMDVIDCFSTDHAPHLMEEKINNGVPGFPGLETILPLLLTAVHSGKLSLEDLLYKLHARPMEIFGLPEQPETYVEVDLDEEWTIGDRPFFTKCNWSPFSGRKVRGSVQRVVLRGRVAFVDGVVLAEKGTGVNMKDSVSPLRPRKRGVSLTVVDKFIARDVKLGKHEPLSVKLSAPGLPKEDHQHSSIDLDWKREDGVRSPQPGQGMIVSPSVSRSATPLSFTSMHHGQHKPIGFDPSLHHPLHTFCPAHEFVGQSLLSVDKLTKEQLNTIFYYANFYLSAFKHQRSIEPVLKGKLMASVFYEVSTRTNCSFSAAMQRLGGSVVSMDTVSSSVKKGESFEDSMIMMSTYADVIVLRHPQPGAAKKAASICAKPVLNAGDGTGEHPTQALLDVFTIREEIGTVNGLVITMGKLMASVFYEVSTRTNCSFSAAMQRLGGSVVSMDTVSSSVKKGESFEDSMIMMSTYADVIVLRHPQPGAAKKAASICAKPVLNAGDGTGEHPTQALLDVFTIREEIGTVNGLVITMVGDLKHGRTVHSLAKLLTLYNVQLRYVSPAGLSMPQSVIDFVKSCQVSQSVYGSLEEALPGTDVLYVTRIQKERFESELEYKKCCGKFVVTPQLMTKAKQKMIVMHPLPRLDEILTDFDTDPRAAYFRQAENGVYIRMAVLSLTLGKTSSHVGQL
ncbi:unnamed protein product [Notodromas monacha]|uniref:aspartate carbamoyltransferase n=1 Tax=Notodromas monacha TaxID=399045 RepID=A0A7R9GIF3_9CRUS|nr:unnamed protein product [Notodromas monacha]CAG0922534.1 unnamed protein product [Notodromas monacha]